MTQHIRPVILSGGAGTRLWPLSRNAAPKQFHKLISDKSLLQKTAERLSGDETAFSAPVILANAAHLDMLQDQLAEVGVAPSMILLEPAPRNTAPAIAAMALAIETREAPEIVVVMPADHEIEDADAFRETLLRAAPFADKGHILTFGIAPTHPETGYGYIKSGEALGDGVWSVSTFAEKPDRATAERYVQSGDYSWNAGIFMFRTDVMVAEMMKFCPEIISSAADAVEKAQTSGAVMHLDRDAFIAAPEDSIDYAIMERTDKAAVAPASMGWSDIGSWATLWEVLGKDERGNVSSGGEAVFIDSAGALAVSDGPQIAIAGVKDVIVVATPDGVLVADKSKAQDVKKIVARLKADNRTNLL
ncbi:MAG: mannose-1-phosphate guanylyltransferase/mannose-6-phosphate isomerase [Pseudomonadota bacterium]